MTQPTTGTRSLQAAALLVAMLVVGGLVPATAAAHAELVTSDPAANAALLEAPRSLSLTFSEAVDTPSATVSVLDTRQQPVQGVGSVSVDAAGTTVSVALPTLTPGTYTVSYQVTSAVDGHVTSGSFAFLIDPTGTQPAPAIGTSSTSLSSGPEVVAARWLALAAALAVSGTVIFWLLSARPALAGAGPPALAAPWGAMALIAAGALLGLVLYLTLAARPIVATAGHAHGTSFALDFAAPFGWTPFAIAMRVALLGSFLTFLVAAGRWIAIDEARRLGRPPPLAADRSWLLAALATATLTLAGMSFAGHAAALGGPLLAMVDLLHLTGVAAWIGTLAGLFLLVRRARAAAPLALRRHSRVALVAAPIVVLTGLANSPAVLGSAPRELLASGYGNLLIAKALLFCVAVGIGAVNYFLVRTNNLRQTLPLVGTELVIGALAVLAAAGLVSGQPSANRQAAQLQAAIGTMHLYGEAGASSIHAAVNLPEPGNQRYQVGVADLEAGAPRTDVQRVFLVFTPPAGSDLTAERVQLQEGTVPGLWGTQGAHTPVIGDWGLEVIVRRIGQRDEAASFDLPVTEARPAELAPPPDTGAGVPAPLTTVWQWLPDGATGWLIVVGLLAAALLLGLLARRRPSYAFAAVRGLLVLAAVMIGLVVGSRALTEAANQAPAAAAAQVNPNPAGPESIARGEAIYLANCAACHGPLGDGDGPSALQRGLVIDPLAEDVTSLTDGQLAYRIRVGTVGTGMPGFASTLSENDRWDLVNYLRDAFGALQR